MKHATCIVPAREARAGGERGFPWPWRRWWWSVTRLHDTTTDDRIVVDELVDEGWAVSQITAHANVQVAIHDDKARALGCETLQ